MGIAFRGQDRGQSYRQTAGQDAAALADRPLPLARLAGRAGLSLVLVAGFFWLLADRWEQVDGAALGQAFDQLHFGQWAAALGFTTLSFWAVGRYDAVLHRHFATGLPARMTRRAGVCSIAVSQALGLGLISGAILRWCMLPGVTLWQATRLTAAVAISFLAGWAVVTAAVLLVLPEAPFRGGAALVLAVAAVLGALSLWGPHLPRVGFRWPNGYTLSRLVGLCALDTLAAALAFHALVPGDLALPFATLLPAFLLALGAGLALGTPGGMGAFEVTFIALLPIGQSPDLLAAILAWRLVYYALPAVLGAGLAIIGPTSPRLPPKLVAHLPPDAPAETGLCHQGDVVIDMVAGQPWMLARRRHCLIAVLDPTGPAQPRALDRALRGLRHVARNESRLPVVYKASARLAAQARAQGQTVRRIGWEGWLHPASYRLEASCRSGLRRKLRRAEASGVTVALCQAEIAPWAALDQIAAEWARAHGAERGFSMGRHDRSYLAHQRIYIAWLAGVPIAYISFHALHTEWALDLMRHRKQIPDGTMHKLIQTAIEDATAAHVTRISLAAVPDGAIGPGDRTCRLIAALVPETAQTGLFRFKSTFAPRWKPLYLIAPHRAGLILAGLSLWRAITRPPPDPA